MNLFKDIISQIDPGAGAAVSAPPAGSPALSSGAPRLSPRPAGATSATPQAPALKRKASGLVDAAQSKIQRKDAPAPNGHANGAPRLAPPAVAKPNTAAPAGSVPYRGTAGLGVNKPANVSIKKPIPAKGPQVAAPKPIMPPAKPAVAPPAAPSAATGKKPGGYLAILQKAKEKDQTKPPAPPIKHEATKIITKKDRERMKMEAKAAAKGKKPVPGITARGPEGKKDGIHEKKKPAEPGYQGTARPAKKPVEVGYKGTARPNSVGPAGKPAAANNKPKPKPQGRYGGYASWSDEELDEEEDDYASDASSDMEGGMWDVEEEEQISTRVGKQEDAEALREENEAKRIKEERKRKLMALSKANANKRKY